MVVDKMKGYSRTADKDTEITDSLHNVKDWVRKNNVMRGYIKCIDLLVYIYIYTHTCNFYHLSRYTWRVRVSLKHPNLNNFLYH